MDQPGVTDMGPRRSGPRHCNHAPKCIGHGDTDERDPLGCCNCGTRLSEEIADAMERSKDLVRDAIRLGRTSRLTAADLAMVVR